MRILTVRQPWAWAIIHGGKDVENRVRNLAGSYRGPVAIHAGMSKDPDAHRHPLIISTWQENQDAYFLHFGAIIGVVDLLGVHDSGDCFHESILRAAELFHSDRETFDGLPFTSGAGGLIGRASFCSEWAQDGHFHLALANPRPLTEPIPHKGALGLRTLDDETTARVLALAADVENTKEPGEP